MARLKRERLTCSQCGWTGLTGHGKVRFAIFTASTTAALGLVGLELAGAIGLGDQVWPIAITILVASIGVRLVIRGDRCGACGAPRHAQDVG